MAKYSLLYFVPEPFIGNRFCMGALVQTNPTEVVFVPYPFPPTKEPQRYGLPILYSLSEAIQDCSSL